MHRHRKSGSRSSRLLLLLLGHRWVSFPSVTNVVHRHRYPVLAFWCVELSLRRRRWMQLDDHAVYNDELGRWKGPNISSSDGAAFRARAHAVSDVDPFTI